MSEENGFIDWQGGKCPVDPDTIVQVRLSGKDGYFIRRAGDLRWCHTNFSGDIVAYHVVKDVRPKVEIPEGFTPWNGGERPVDKKVIVKVQLSSGGESLGPAGVFDWSRLSNGGDIVAYRVVEDEKLSFEIPEDFTLWSGGACPAPVYARVEVILRSGSWDLGAYAGDWNWRTSNSNGDIIAYRVVEPPKPEVQIPEGFTPWAGGSECPVTADTEIDVVVRDGSKGSCAAGDLKWTHTGHGNDIVAYRVIEAQKSQTARDIQIGGDHYKKSTVQPWDVVDTWPIEQQIGFYRGNALKYVMRMGTKDENLREIRKAAHYLQKLAEVLEQKGGV